MIAATMFDAAALPLSVGPIADGPPVRPAGQVGIRHNPVTPPAIGRLKEQSPDTARRRPTFVPSAPTISGLGQGVPPPEAPK